MFDDGQGTEAVVFQLERSSNGKVGSLFANTPTRPTGGFERYGG